jgi:hypothetical protein
MMKPVSSLRELRQLSDTDDRYALLITTTAENLGWDGLGDVPGAYGWLVANANCVDADGELDVDGEESIVDEVNFCIGLIGDELDGPIADPRD